MSAPPFCPPKCLPSYVSPPPPAWSEVETLLSHEDIIFQGIRDIKIEFIHLTLLYTGPHKRPLFFHITNVLLVLVTIPITILLSHSISSGCPPLLRKHLAGPPWGFALYTKTPSPSSNSELSSIISNPFSKNSPSEHKSPVLNYIPGHSCLSSPPPPLVFLPSFLPSSSAPRNISPTSKTGSVGGAVTSDTLGKCNNHR